MDKNGSVVLPELTDDDRERAESQDNLAWAYSLMEWYSHGAVHKADDLGLVFQVIKDPETDECGIRVLSAYEAETCLTFLAMLERTFVTAGYKVEIEPYFILRPTRRRQHTRLASWPSSKLTTKKRTLGK